jgi:hypothetical protein
VMKSLAAALLLAVSVPVLGHGDFPPQRGGISTWAGETTLEFVFRDGKALVYIDDHGKPLPVKGAEGTLVLPTEDGTGRAVRMKVAGVNWFEAAPVKVKPGGKVKFFAKMPDGDVHVGEVAAP